MPRPGSRRRRPGCRGPRSAARLNPSTATSVGPMHGAPSPNTMPSMGHAEARRDRPLRLHGALQEAELADEDESHDDHHRAEMRVMRPIQRTGEARDGEGEGQADETTLNPSTNSRTPSSSRRRFAAARRRRNRRHSRESLARAAGCTARRRTPGQRRARSAPRAPGCRRRRSRRSGSLGRTLLASTDLTMIQDRRRLQLAQDAPATRPSRVQHQRGRQCALRRLSGEGEPHAAGVGIERRGVGHLVLAGEGERGVRGVGDIDAEEFAPCRRRRGTVSGGPAPRRGTDRSTRPRSSRRGRRRGNPWPTPSCRSRWCW